MSELRPCDHDPRVLTTGDVLQASSITVRPGMMPLRVVVRDVSRVTRPEFVVHTELLESGPPGDGTSCSFRHYAFDQGDYFSSAAAARARFEVRAGRL